MMISINEPTLSPEGRHILERLTSHGWKVSWYIDPILGGHAGCDIDNQKIIFRSVELSNDPAVVLHELLHFDLYDKGYPFVRANTATTNQAVQFGVTILNDVCHHIMMKQEFERAGFYFGTQEVPSTVKQIDELVKTNPTLNPVFLGGGEIFSAALYMRAKFLTINKAKIELLARYISKNNKHLTLNKISEAINMLPEPGCSVDEYNERLNKLLSILGLDNFITISRK